MNKRSKTLALQRAYFNEGFNGTLEQIARSVFLKLPSAKDRRKDTDFFSFVTYASIDESVSGSGVFVRVFEAEEGGTGVIDLDTTDTSKAIEEFFHPDNKRFLKDEVILFIIGDTIISCNCKNKAGTFVSGLLHLAQSTETVGSDVRVRVSDVPDRTVLDRIVKTGVREVDISVTSYLASMDMGSRSLQKDKLMRMIFGMPTSNGSESRKRANAVGRIVLKRGRFKTDELKRDQWLTEIAKEVAEDSAPDIYKITLEDGSKISNSNLRKAKSVKINRHANSYDFNNARLELEIFLRDLIEQRYVDI